METKHEEIVEILKLGMMMEKEHFKEVELYICKGRQLQMKDFVNHLKVCVDSIDYDIKRHVDPKDVLETTRNAMQNMIKAFNEELTNVPNLISNKIAEKEDNVRESADHVKIEISGLNKAANKKRRNKKA